MQEILAKGKAFKTITLKDHTKGLLEQLEKLKDKLDYQTIDYRLIKLAIFAHDIGKVLPSFQIRVGNWDYSPKMPFPDIPHSLFSLLWINKHKLADKLSNKNELKILLSAVAFHHWRDNFQNIILGNDREFKRAVDELLRNEDLRVNLLKNLKKQFKGDDFKDYLDILDFNEDIALTISDGNDLFPYIAPPYHSYFLPQRLPIDEEYKKKWIYTAGLLIRTDHFTSFIQEEGLSEEIEKPFPKYSTVKNNIRGKIGNREIWQIKEAENNKDNNLILIAPTGSGKTEFAYLWGADSKLFITLPLRSAVNAIYERSKVIFGQDNIGLLHSDADVYLYGESSSTEGERFRVLDLARQLSLPVLVTTGDQIFPSVLKYPGYEKIYSTLGYSRLVIDEVQAYDPRAAALIVKLIEDIVKLGGKFLLMTATLPPFIRTEIENRIGKDGFKIIDKYDSNEKICKHRIEFREDDITNSIDEILTKASKEKKRVIVILNTVKKAQEVYEKIDKANKENIYLKLIHSRFTFNDRKNLEDEIVGSRDKPGAFSNPKPDSEQEGKILVATQVVEASLDIDADVLYTELAPIDSLVQRMGRVLRRVRDMESYKRYLGAEEPFVSNIIVFKNSGKGVYKEDLLSCSQEWIKNHPSRITDHALLIIESDKNKWVEGFYNLLGKKTEDRQKEIEDRQKSKNKKHKKKTDKPEENLQENYLQRFYETLEILDAGYMSDKKQEALRIFREIYTVPAIPKDERGNFKKSIEGYLNRNNNEINYTSFKSEVLSKYVVDVDIRKYLKPYGIFLSPVTDWIYELNIEDEEKLKKIKRWLRDIYTVKCEYNSKVGVIFNETKSDDNIF